MGVVGLSVVGSIAAPPAPTATADADSASATALGIPGVFAVSESTASIGGDPHWTGASVADTEVIGKSEAGWTGAAAPAGSVVDAVNANLCPGSVAIDAATELALCASVLNSGAYSGNESVYGYSAAGGQIATVTAVVITDNGDNAYGAVASLANSGAGESRQGCRNDRYGYAELATIAYQAGDGSTFSGQQVGATDAYDDSNPCG